MQVKNLTMIHFTIQYIVIIISILGFALFAMIAQLYSTTTAQTWTNGASMPTARTEVAGAVLDGKIYVIGGYDESGETIDIVQVYDPRADNWSKVSSLPEPVDHAAAATYDGKLFVVGGYLNFEGARTPTNKSLMYDPSTDRWKEIKSMPSSRGALTANFINDTLFAVGGQDSSRKTVNTNEAYDWKKNKWTEREPMPTRRHHLASAVVDGKLYVIGGRQTDKSPDVNIGTNEVYDPKLDKWTSLKSMPTKRSGLAAAALGNNIYVFGGEHPFKDDEPLRTFNNTEIYHIKTGKWTAGSPLPTARHGLTAEEVNGTIYVIGGGPEPGLSYSHANEIFHIK
jgi:N-acetylneuraminic acid mutarotase